MERRVHVQGTITSAGFSRGDRIVVGHWPISPLGPMFDVMWALPSGRRLLLAPSERVAAFITSIYEFDDVRVGSLSVTAHARTVGVSGLGLDLSVTAGRKWPLPIRRPLALTRYVEAPIARRLMGVETYGVSPLGAREWYQTSGLRWLRDGAGSADGNDLGELVELTRPVGVGFSEPPRRPSMVSVRTTIEFPRAAPAVGAG